MTARRAWSVGFLLLATSGTGCGSNANPYSVTVGSDDAGGSFGPGSDAGDDGALAAHIEQNDITVTIVTLSCAGPCADVVAVPSGGQPPYTFAWNDGTTTAARSLCPTSDTNYSVRVTDTGTTGELTRAAESVSVPLTADVLVCPDGGGGACAPGSYTGTWNATGPVDGGASDTSSYVPNPTGPLTLVLAGSTASGGASTLMPTGTFPIDWAVAAQWLVHPSGSLDCATGAFRAEDPTAAFTVGGLSTGTCDFTLTGHYDPGSASLAGEWTSLCGSSDWGGTWTVSLAP
jgi:hypothetical protein